MLVAWHLLSFWKQCIASEQMRLARACVSKSWHSRIIDFIWLPRNRKNSHARPYARGNWLAARFTNAPYGSRPFLMLDTACLTLFRWQSSNNLIACEWKDSAHCSPCSCSAKTHAYCYYLAMSFLVGKFGIRILAAGSGVGCRAPLLIAKRSCVLFSCWHYIDWHCIFWLAFHFYRRRQHLRVGAGRHCVQRGGAARFKNKNEKGSSGNLLYKHIKKLPYRYVAMSSHVPYKLQT